MNKTDILIAIEDLTRMGDAITADVALDKVALLAAGLDPARPSYERDLGALLSIGAHIWQRQAASAGKSG